MWSSDRERWAYPAHGGGHELASHGNGVQQQGKVSAGLGSPVLLAQDPSTQSERIGLQGGKGYSQGG